MSPLAFSATKRAVSNHGEPPDEFLSELVNWGRTADAEIFVPNDRYDVYSSVFGALGPYPAEGSYRRACMLEIMRVLAAFESSWVWTCGRDTTAGPETPSQMEAGAWQVSADSLDLGKDLVACLEATAPGASHDPYRFQAVMKSNHTLAMEYISRLLRITVKANGPVLRKEINPWLSRGAVAEFQTLLGM